MANLLSIGHTTLDTFLIVGKRDRDNPFEFGAKVPVKEIHYGLGGGAANTAAGVRKLGHKVSIFTIIGDDPKGEDISQAFSDLDIDKSFVSKDTNPSDQSTVVSFDNDRVIFSYSFPRKYQIDNINYRYPYIFLSSVGGDITDLYSNIAKIKKADSNKILFFNPGSRELREYRNQIIEFLPSVDYLIVNFEEACAILNPGLKRDQIDVYDLMDLLRKKGIKNVLITDAENGVYVSHEKDEFQIESFSTNIVEKTGAGDAFASGFISAVMYGKDFREASGWGLANAASVMKIIGAQNGLLNKKDMAKYPLP